VTLSRVLIEDSPEYSYRGLLLDTARNFIPIPSILRTLDGMSTCKLNAFHWHITDSQSFPLEIPNMPEINSFGAYSESQIYRVSEIKSIIEYAKNRGIRVIFEFDSPSHVGQGFQWGPEKGLGIHIK
jgi:hexosaminidase